jgi:pyridoxamine 5'-phosphate oxidase
MASSDPFDLFSRWLADARAAGAVLPQAMALATADADGMPDARMVMLRSYSRDGFVFFTDRDSAKGDQLRANPRAVLLGYWRELGRQVRVSGRVEATSPTEDDEAFRERPRDAQLAIAAWRQGTRIDAPWELLHTVVLVIEQHFRNFDVPRPARWGGYRLLPERFVFWQERPDRIHRRQEYRRAANGEWMRTLLAP